MNTQTVLWDGYTFSLSDHDGLFSSGVLANRFPFHSLALQGKDVSQESVKQFYDSWMSRQNTFSSQDGLDEPLPPPSSPPAVPSSHQAYAKLKNQASKVSWGSSISRYAASVSPLMCAHLCCMCEVRIANIPYTLISLLLCRSGIATFFPSYLQLYDR